jgi:hypothetical protein
MNTNSEVRSAAITGEPVASCNVEAGQASVTGSFDMASRHVDVLTVGGVACELHPTGNPRRWGTNWELVAPDGYEFSGGEYALLFKTKAEARATAAQESLTRIGGAA